MPSSGRCLSSSGSWSALCPSLEVETISLEMLVGLKRGQAAVRLAVFNTPSSVLLCFPFLLKQTGIRIIAVF